VTATAATNMSDSETRAFFAKPRERDRRIDAGLPPSRPRGDAAPRSKRRPLFVAPIEPVDDDTASERHPPGYRYDEDNNLLPFVQTAINALSEERRKAPMTAEDGFTTLDCALKLAFQGDEDLFDCIKKLRIEVAELKLENARERAAAAELRAKQSEHEFIISRLKIENAGPIGPQGLMGRDGHEGRPGARGERGETGKAGPRPVAFAVDDAAFSATMVMSDGGTGPVLHLRGMFETYNEQVDASDASAEADADRARRDEVEQEVARQRLGLPAR
jgi:hypothetical protein